jgi:hypothetical protein
MGLRQPPTDAKKQQKQQYQRINTGLSPKDLINFSKSLK